MDRAHSQGRDRYRLIIVRRNGLEILVSSSGFDLSLPCLEISSEHRIAEQLTKRLYAERGLGAYCLFTLNPSRPDRQTERSKYAVMEVLQNNDRAPAASRWLPIAGKGSRLVDPPEDNAAITDALEEMNTALGPFARPGWLPELFAWVQTQIDPLALRVTGAIRQLNAGRTFSLIRLETTGPAIWFKATGEPNLHELSISLALARLFPDHVPEILGVHRTWNGWLSKDAPGSLLDDCEESFFWEKAARQLAALQLASVGKSTELLESSCKDLRLPRLIKLVDPFLARMADLMAAQVKQPPEPLPTTSLTLLGERLKEACALLHELDLPDTLGHSDCNPGNIVVSPTRCFFLDWAEGCVSHPFLTFEYLREHSRRRLRDSDAAGERMAAAYARPWESVVSPDTVTQAMAISPLVAVFITAIVHPAWRSLDALQDPAVAGYFRSLTRRMFREAARLGEGSERCVR
jgi:hypothetical protein